MEKAIDQFSSFCLGKALCISPGKTQFLVIGAKEEVKLTIKGVTLSSKPEVTRVRKRKGKVKKPIKTMKILGAVIDERLTWDPHAISRVQSAMATARNIVRNLRGLDMPLLEKTMRTFVHPILDYCLLPLAAPSNKAEQRLRRVYNKTARWAATRGRAQNKIRSAPALQKLGWPTWGERREAQEERYTMRVWVHERPAPLRKLLDPTSDDIFQFQSTRLLHRNEEHEPRFTTKVGEKSFSWKGPRVVNKVDSTEPEGSESGDSGPEDNPVHTCIGPLAAWRELQDQKKFEAYLDKRFEGQRDTTHKDKTVIWTDGSYKKGTAGVSAFYGNKNPRNTLIPIYGRKRSSLVAEM
eukprot:Hpha_TRINITY_DN16829_c3_g4::TRINITY_DN16829_c3_g4_i1::g.152713::m.152713